MAGRDRAGTADDDGVTLEELRLATRNHGMPLEALRHDVTPLGLHYVLIHYDIPAVDSSTWALQVDGLVGHPTGLSLADLRQRHTVTRQVTMECAGTGRAQLHPRPFSQPWLDEAIGTGEWEGTPAAELLDDLGLGGDATEAVFTGADRGIEGGLEQAYARSVSLRELRDTGALLVWGLNGMPLPPQHGAPLRLIVPGWYGMANVKWLSSITVTDRPFDGYQQTHAYRFRNEPDEPGEPLSRMAVHSLMVPPGLAEFPTRRRVAERGTHELSGRAWSGHGPITSVEVSTDGGRSWQAAALEQAADPAAWTRWRAEWRAETPGEHELRCRATDTAGNRQPDEPIWNVGGYAVNAVQRVAVTVR